MPGRRQTLTDAASRPDATRDADDELQTWDCSAVAPTLGSFARQGMINNSPVAIARKIAARNAACRSLVARARARGVPIACALDPRTFAFGGGRALQ